MNDERKVSREGIHIDRDIADSVAIEAELDANITGPYRFPDPVKRMIPAGIYLVTTVLVTLLIGPWPAVIVAAVAVWHAGSAWTLKVDQTRALALAAAAVDFSVGHASAAVGFHGLRARPRWSVILYSAVEPPDYRALVTLDAITGDVLEQPFVEKVSDQ